MLLRCSELNCFADDSDCMLMSYSHDELLAGLYPLIMTGELLRVEWLNC